MGYRDELIRRLKESGAWDKAPPELRGQLERLDDGVARVVMVAFDGLDSPVGYMDDEETKFVAAVTYYQLMLGVVQAFDGKLFELDLRGKPRPSELGHALLEFTSVAKDHGFATETAIVEHLSFLTWETLRALQKAAERDAGDGGLAE